MPFLTIFGFNSKVHSEQKDVVNQIINHLKRITVFDWNLGNAIIQVPICSEYSQDGVTVEIKYDNFPDRSFVKMQNYFADVGNIVSHYVNKNIRSYFLSGNIRVVGPTCNKLNEPYWTNSEQENDPVKFLAKEGEGLSIFFNLDDAIRFRLNFLLKMFRETKSENEKKVIIEFAQKINSGQWPTYEQLITAIERVQTQHSMIETHSMD